MDELPELGLLFHRLNNQLGIILAHAELLEAKSPDNIQRARALAGGRQRPRGDGTPKKFVAARPIPPKNCNQPASES
jgi:hypothetical protein